MRRVELLVVIEPDADADAEEIDRLGRQLRRELRSLDVDDVVPAGDGAAPAGSKGADAASVTELLVTLSASGGVFAMVVATVKDWVGRRSGAGKVSLTIDGDTLELDGATAAEREELIDTFVRRHQPA
jgi:Effector Associated Constant Component 1